MGADEFAAVLNAAAAGDADAQLRLTELAVAGRLDGLVADLTAERAAAAEDDAEFDAVLAEITAAHGDPPPGVLLAEMLAQAGEEAIDAALGPDRILEATVPGRLRVRMTEAQVAGLRRAVEANEQREHPEAWAERTAEELRAISDAAWERFDRERFGDG